MPPRPPMPERVKRAVLILNMGKNGGALLCAELGLPLTAEDALKGRIQFDHSPPVALRFFDTQTQKYQPDANNPDFIEVVGIDGHSIRTNKKRGLYHGDQTQIAKVARIAAGGKKRRGPKIKSRGFEANRINPFRKPVRGPAVRRH